MNVGIDACNGITASLGVLERFVGNVEPQAGNLTNYQVNNGYADVPEGAEAGARWNYLLSVNLGEYVFEDVEVKFGLDFDPADDFDAPTSQTRTPSSVRSPRRSRLWRRRRASTTAKRASSKTARTSTLDSGLNLGRRKRGF